MYPKIRLSIDRGGTFTDIYAEIDDDSENTRQCVLKLLSVDPDNYADAPTEGIRRILNLATGQEQKRSRKLDISNVEFIRMGTTIATNALLERQGVPCALVTTEGLGDILEIGNQARPQIFDLKVRKMPPLHLRTVEVQERIRLDKGSCGVGDNQKLSFIVQKPLDKYNLSNELAEVRSQGITSLAVAFMHSYGFKDHEQSVRQIAESLGFSHVSLSSELTPMVKLVPRAFTATVDAYLTPKIREYIANFKKGFVNDLKGVDVQFMQSDGGLCDIDSFCGYLSILSGPAGGVVGYARSAYGYESFAPEIPDTLDPMPVIGFDMGGTSTDVSRYAGHFEHVFETETAGVTIQAPQLDINTVAAGGGSRLFYRSGMFYVGPESAGAHPGPVCYRKGGYLTITDANLMLGRIQPTLFPHIFGDTADQPLDVDATRRAFEELTNEINDDVQAGKKKKMTPEEVAEGFIKVANEAMCRPIRELTEGKGHDLRDHTLACFGGAGGQHACAIARSLQIGKVFVHKYSGILSAFGIALADNVVEKQQAVGITYNRNEEETNCFTVLGELKAAAEALLKGRGFPKEAISSELYLNLRYDGTDFAIMIQCPKEMAYRPQATNYAELFVEEYIHEHGFHIPNRSIIVDDVRVRAIGSTNVSQDISKGKANKPKLPIISLHESGEPVRMVGDAKPALTTSCYFSEEGGWTPTEVWTPDSLRKGQTVLPGPCLIVDSKVGNTIVIEPHCVGRIGSDGNVFIDIQSAGRMPSSFKSSKAILDPVNLSIYSHRFMGIAEQMGRTLQRTAVSTNIKERLDFSCALFDETGGLVANAPHVPVHLGAMQDAIRFQIRILGGAWLEGEVLLSNHPSAGGTHLPDITVITPVFYDGKAVFYVASRGHHADVGGATPGSMPPFSKSLSDEGMAVKSLRLVKDGLFQEKEVTNLLSDAGCRCIRDVISDLRAQVAANKKGIGLVKELIGSQGLQTVQSYMHYIQDAAARAVKEMLKEIFRERKLANGEKLVFSDHMDDGTEISVSVEIDGKNGCATFDFTRSGHQVCGNTNAPRAITSSAIIYSLRCLVQQDVPLNQGCLDPIKIQLPENSILSPTGEAAVVGGNVLTSQRITDVVLGALRACAASQGCMNNFTFGNESMGYYETIGGGAGAGNGWNGTSGVQTHMTNTRITDPEVLERRYPAVVRQFAIRKHSGGSGKWKGGNGLIRAIEFTEPLTVSILSERRNTEPWGLEGGHAAKRGINELICDGVTRRLEGKSSFQVQRGDIVRINTPGGGGYGQV